MKDFFFQLCLSMHMQTDQCPVQVAKYGFWVVLHLPQLEGWNIEYTGWNIGSSIFGKPVPFWLPKMVPYSAKGWMGAIFAHSIFCMTGLNKKCFENRALSFHTWVFHTRVLMGFLTWTHGMWHKYHITQLPHLLFFLACGHKLLNNNTSLVYMVLIAGPGTRIPTVLSTSVKT